MAALSVAAIERSVCARYQPIVEIDGGRVAGCEALARWRGEDGTLTSIGPLADAIEQDEDLATALTARMLECVDRDLLDLLVRNPSFYVSINLPPITLGRERLRPVLQGLGLAQRGPQLVGEITERRALDDLGRAAIREIRRVGAKIALDDFGTRQLRPAAADRPRGRYPKNRPLVRPRARPGPVGRAAGARYRGAGERAAGGARRGRR